MNGNVNHVLCYGARVTIKAFFAFGNSSIASSTLVSKVVICSIANSMASFVAGTPSQGCLYRVAICPNNTILGSSASNYSATRLEMGGD